MNKKHSFTRKEIALFLDMIAVMQTLDPKVRKLWNMSDNRLKQMYFKLYRIL